MALLSEDEVKIIAERCGYNNYDLLQYEIKNYSEDVVGYLGEHLRLVIKIISRETTEVVLFVKCVPRFDQYKAQYLRESGFFRAEYVLLSSLFNQFSKCEGKRKWRPALLYIKDEVFVFEDVTQIGYTISDCRQPFSYDETVATVEAVAKFHADSLIFEHKKSKQLKRTYRIWEEFQEYLQEPLNTQSWRDTGRNGVIDVLNGYSAYKHLPNFSKLVEDIVPVLFDKATDSMKPSSKFINVVVHRDVWSNNVFFKTMNNGKIHALIVDFQTAIYTSPMHDMASLMFLNTTKKFRKMFTERMLDVYYACLSETLKEANIDISELMDKEQLLMAYEDSIMFGITQAALVLPIANLPEVKKDKYCRKGSEQFDSISRSHCFIESIEEDEQYRNCILELFEDIVERYIIPDITE